MSRTKSEIMEIWKDIDGYKGRYQVSDQGAIKSLVSRHGIPSEKRLKLHKNNIGYLNVGLCDINGRVRRYYVHRLVCKAFVGDIPPRYEVNHKNGIKEDNRAANLEIVTSSENQQHAYRTGLQKPLTTGKGIVALKNGNVIGTFKSIKEMCQALSLNRPSVGRVLKGTRSKHHGYTFRLNN